MKQKIAELAYKAHWAGFLPEGIARDLAFWEAGQPLFGRISSPLVWAREIFELYWHKLTKGIGQ